MPSSSSTAKCSVFTSTQVGSLLEPLDKPKHKFMLVFAYGCGLRVSEVTRLKLKD